MAQIQLFKAGPEEWTVEVAEGGSVTTHRVKLSEDQRSELAPDAEPEEMIEESFRFLLEREPKESILPEFSLPVIGRYFPEYPEEIRRRLG